MCIKALDKKQPRPKISILQAMTSLVSSWNAVSPDVIVNCFSKAGISDSNQQVALIDEDDPFEGLIEELEKLREAHPDAVPENVSAESFSAVDDHVIVIASVPTDSEILSQILGDSDDSDGEIVIEDLRKAKRKTLWKRCRMLRCIALTRLFKTSMSGFHLWVSTENRR